jgi:hypothetical protein
MNLKIRGNRAHNYFLCLGNIFLNSYKVKLANLVIHGIGGENAPGLG